MRGMDLADHGVTTEEPDMSDTYTASVDRATFAVRQAEMTAKWFENVKAREGDVETYIQKRRAAYIDRWREAARFFANGHVILDIGGGNLFEDLLELFRQRRFDYHYIDIDQTAVDGARVMAARFGFNAARFSTSFNDRLEYPDNHFDGVFSSHCIEHSFDIASTFREIHRVLKPGGTLTLAVPMGWENNLEHPYFLGGDEWVALVEDHGFRIRVCQSGCEYAEHGYDLFIAAAKIAVPGRLPRIDPENYRKRNFRFVPIDDDSLVCQGEVVVARDQKILCGSTWTIDIGVPAGAKEILPIFARHNWSGIVELTCANARVSDNLFHWFSYVQPARVTFPEPLRVPSICAVRPLGASQASFSSQAVLLGALLR